MKLLSLFFCPNLKGSKFEGHGSISAFKYCECEASSFIFFILSIWFEFLVLNQFQWRWLLISTSQHSHQSLLLFSSPNPITLLSLNHHTSSLLNSTVTLFCPFLPARTKNLLLWISALRLYMLNLLPPLIPESPCFLLITFWSLVPPKVSFFWSLWLCLFFLFF